jgi:hypothetical protein
MTMSDEERKRRDRERARKYYHAHIEERRAYDRQRQTTKNEAQAEYRRNWLKQNKSEIARKAKERRTSPEGLEYARRYQETHKEYLKEKRERWAAENPERYAYLQRRSRLRKYGMTPEDYDALLLAQGGVCAICRTEETDLDSRRNKPRSLAVDHDHESGRVRALLCGMCNKGIGAFMDNADLMRAAVNYLETGK